jgi:hypothetical protein
LHPTTVNYSASDLICRCISWSFGSTMSEPDWKARFLTSSCTAAEFLSWKCAPFENCRYQFGVWNLFLKEQRIIHSAMPLYCPGADSSIGSRHRTLPRPAQKPQPSTSLLIASRPWHLVLLRRISSRRSSSRRLVASLHVVPLLLSSPRLAASRHVAPLLLSSHLSLADG